MAGRINTFQFAHAYARGEGMKHYTEMVQEPEFAARRRDYGDPGRFFQREGADGFDRGRAVPLIRALNT